MKKLFIISLIALFITSCGNKTEKTEEILIEEEPVSEVRIYTPEEKQIMADLDAMVGANGTNVFNYKLDDQASAHLPYASRKYRFKVFVGDRSEIINKYFKVKSQIMHYNQNLTEKMLNGNGYGYVEDPIYKLNDSARINEIQTNLILDPHFDCDTVIVLTEKVLTKKGFNLKQKQPSSSTKVFKVVMEKGDTIVEITPAPQKTVCYNIYIYDHDRIFSSTDYTSGYYRDSRIMHVQELDSVPESQFPH